MAKISNYRIVIDLDHTITATDSVVRDIEDYKHLKPNQEVVAKIRHFRELGYEIVISTSRNMRTFEGNVGKINVHTLPVIIEWMEKHNIPFDEIHVAKPWCGRHGFYVDDRSIRPDEFARLSESEIKKLIC